MNFLTNNLLAEVGAPVAAASDTDQNSDRLDMSGYDGVVFLVPITDSVDTGVAALTIEQNDDDSDTGMSALTGAVATATSAANDDLNNKLLIVDVYRPTKRYIQGVITSTVANIAFGNTLAIRYKGSKAPISADASVAASALVAGPAEA